MKAGASVRETDTEETYESKKIEVMVLTSYSEGYGEKVRAVIVPDFLALDKDGWQKGVFFGLYRFNGHAFEYEPDSDCRTPEECLTNYLAESDQVLEEE